MKVYNISAHPSKVGTYNDYIILVENWLRIFFIQIYVYIIVRNLMFCWFMNHDNHFELFIMFMLIGIPIVYTVSVLDLQTDIGW